MSEDTITIKKDKLWKYSTFFLLAFLIVGAIIFFTGNNSSGNANETGNVVDTAAVSLDIFMDSSLYPSLGPEDAEKVVVEFSDFQCPYCALASGLPSWATEYGSQYKDLIGSAGKVQNLAAEGKVRFIYVSMSFLGQESVYAAQATYCAKNQEKFWEMHDAIFKASTGPEENDGRYSKENLKVIAKTISGLDTTKFNECLDNDETLYDVQRVASQASQVASGTPTFYVNGKQVSASWNALSAALA
jgi:protein-disulfide isomerase